MKLHAYRWQLTYHQDPGHGWIEVSSELLLQLGIEKEISYCSYMKGKRIFLEEDGDASTLIRALDARDEDYDIRTKHVEGEHWIRSLKPYKNEYPF